MYRIRTASFSLPRAIHFVRTRYESISMDTKTGADTSSGLSPTSSIDKPVEATIRRKLEGFFSPFGLLHMDVINESHKHNVPKVRNSPVIRLVIVPAPTYHIFEWM